MKKNNASIESFAHYMSIKVTKMADRAVAILYFYAVNKDTGASLKQIITDFDRAGLGKPNITKLRKAMIKDRRTIKISDDSWRLKGDKIVEVGEEFQLGQYFSTQQPKPMTVDGNFIDKNRFRALKKKKGKFDFSRLLKMLTELDHAFSVQSYISVTFLVRAILDHVPPIFSLDSFTKVANNYGSKSFNDINRAAQSVFNFRYEKFPNESITSTRAQLINDWILSLARQEMSNAERNKKLSQFLDLIVPEMHKENSSKILKQAGVIVQSDTEASRDFYARSFHQEIYTRAKKSAGRRGIPPHTPPAAHALTTRRSAAGGEGATPQKIASRSDTTFFHFNY
jgi:hypothetical protein